MLQELLQTVEPSKSEAVERLFDLLRLGLNQKQIYAAVSTSLSWKEVQDYTQLLRDEVNASPLSALSKEALIEFNMKSSSLENDLTVLYLQAYDAMTKNMQGVYYDENGRRLMSISIKDVVLLASTIQKFSKEKAAVLITAKQIENNETPVAPSSDTVKKSHNMMTKIPPKVLDI